jgi:predicted kinase
MRFSIWGRAKVLTFEPKAFVMVGPPGAGKTTYSQHLANTYNAVILSGDDIRADLYGSAEIQGNWGEIWQRLEELVAENCGMPVILDGTHCRTDYRTEAITLLKSYGYTHINAVVVERSLATCLRQNAGRRRKVPKHVIHQMFSDLQNSLDNIKNEGFTTIEYV